MIETDKERRKRLLSAQWWTPAEAGFMLNRDKRKVNQWIVDGLPALTIGRRRYIRPAEARQASIEHDRRAHA